MSNNFPNIDAGAERYGVKKSSFFKFSEGENKIRVLAISQEPIATHFVNGKPFVCVGISEGCPFHGENAPMDAEGQPKTPGLKYLTYVIDRKDGSIQQADLPISIISQLQKIRGAEGSDYYFDGFPMPYDLNITFKEKEAPAKKYMVVPGKNSEAVPQSILDELAKKKSLDDLVELKKKKTI